jgi:A/G-specific adenine glycosylase
MTSSSNINLQQFQKALQAFYVVPGRQMPWRVPETAGTFDLYKIMVSEVMLQQTQVNRVIPKYQEFIQKFPDINTLAEASLGDVLVAWSGLGYNRRAKYLHQAAQQMVKDYSVDTSQTLNMLSKLPGIGHNTAAAICVYAYNQPQVFIETNIRTVFIHHFFSGTVVVEDKAITPILGECLAGQDPRTFYWALMDYGTYLKATHGNLNSKSKHYSKQSSFHGSRRQIRGQVIRLLAGKAYSQKQLAAIIRDSRLEPVLGDLTSEGLIVRTKTIYTLA